MFTYLKKVKFYGKKNFGTLSIIAETFQRYYLIQKLAHILTIYLISQETLYKIYIFLFKLFN